MNKKKLVTGLAAVALVASLGFVGGSLAWFTDNDQATNTFTTNHIDIELDEPGYNDNQVVLPGSSFVKSPEITLTKDSSPAYVRITKAKVVATLSDGSIEMFDLEDFGLNHDTKKWTVSEDGAYVVYNEVLKPGEKVYPFGENATIVIPQSFGNKYADAKFTIQFTAEAVQADNNESGFAADGLVIEQYNK